MSENKNRKSIFWKLSARVEREGDVIRIVLNPGPSGDVYKTLKDYKITEIPEEEGLYLKRIIKNNFIICEEKIKNSSSKSDQDIVKIIQSLHIARKVNRDRWKVDVDYIKTQFAKDKAPKPQPKKPMNKGKNAGKFNNNNQDRRGYKTQKSTDKFSPAQRKYNRMDNSNKPAVVKKKVKKVLIKRQEKNY